MGGNSCTQLYRVVMNGHSLSWPIDQLHIGMLLVFLHCISDIYKLKLVYIPATFKGRELNGLKIIGCFSETIRFQQYA